MNSPTAACAGHLISAGASIVHRSFNIPKAAKRCEKKNDLLGKDSIFVIEDCPSLETYAKLNGAFA